MFGKKGNIEIVIPKTSYAYGETIQGTVKLTMNKPHKAKEFRLLFTGEQNKTSYGGPGANVGGVRVGMTGGQKKKTNTATLHSFKVTLDGEKEYDSKEYPFQVTVPQIQTAEKPEGTVGNVVNAMQFMSGTTMQIKWKLKATLDVPMDTDINKEIEIIVTNPQPPTQPGNI
ncbi:hypothetical protein K8R43_06200 [archaeon]|nr:hypothetical protein [archaeon]